MQKSNSTQLDRWPLPEDGAVYDVIVVGAGGAGLTAAVCAASLGLSVAVLEKSPFYGGVTALAAGGIWIPGNDQAKSDGVPDGYEEALEYVARCAGERFDESRVASFLRAGPEMLRFLEREADVVFDLAVGRPDYRPWYSTASVDGARTLHPRSFDGRKLGGEIARLRPPLAEMTFLGLMIKPGPDLRHFLNVFRSFESAKFVVSKVTRHFWDLLVHGRGMTLSNGNALIARLAKASFDRGVHIFTSVNVTGLSMRDGKVAGVTFEKNGADSQLVARRGVVMACGGFSHDIERRRALYTHAPTGAEHWSPAPDTHTGDGIRMSESVGAHFDTNLTDAAGWAPVSLVPNRRSKAVAFPHLIDRQKPGFIAVTREGRRFVNEASSYHDFGRGLASACIGKSETCAFLIANQSTIRRYGIGAVKPAPIPYWRHLRSGYLLKAATLTELAIKAGIDPVQLTETVAEFNLEAAEGMDSKFGKGQNHYNRYNGDPTHRPNPCLAPLDRGPYFAVKLVMGELGTFAGIRTDARSRALDVTGEPIPGLYAAGNDAQSLFGGDYVGGGATIGPGMVAGYIAAQELCFGIAAPR
ncbi:FAD-dependent oxidoreductase [Paraburkholderia caribensis]|uniref:FAD-dependent oxidoreductase n=1 Tax=Paraburkholderia caribensis TaxID=75105 RepID=UPI001CAF84A8|nr:FAD-dependent oxidoreductase [Paraburkholderia caribensis]CAG9269682.1 Succinate dehydrogenase/fumarate reductase flavoprotein subunit [Paraburkholderia caribensis]